MSDAVVDSIVQWFQQNAKIPLNSVEKNAVAEKLSEAGIDRELLALAEDADLRELCPVSLNLTRKWQLKEALRTIRGKRFHFLFCFSPPAPALRAKRPLREKADRKH